MNKKIISDWTLNDVRSFMGLVKSQSENKNRNYYVQFEDKYTNNPYAYISGSKTHSGGGRITIAYVISGNNTIQYLLSDEETYYDFDTICEKLYDYIQENY